MLSEAGLFGRIEYSSPERLSEQLKGLSESERGIFFDSLRLKLYGVDTEAVHIPNEISESNKIGLEQIVSKNTFTNLGYIGNWKVVRSQVREKHKPLNSLCYSVYLGEKIEGHGSIEWFWEDNEQPINTHRYVTEPERQTGMGSLLMRLSEEAFKIMRFKEMQINTSTPAFASWFFRFGFQPKHADCPPKLLRALLNKEKDLNKSFYPNKYMLSKVLKI